jgi:hypothetical protein
VQPEGADGDLEGLEGLSGDLGLQVRRLRRVHRQRPAPPGGGARLLRRHGHVVARLHVGPQLPHGFREVPLRHLLRCRGSGARGAHGSSQRLNQPLIILLKARSRAPAARDRRGAGRWRVCSQFGGLTGWAVESWAATQRQVNWATEAKLSGLSAGSLWWRIERKKKTNLFVINQVCHALLKKKSSMLC